MTIDWSKAPSWAIAHALYAFGGEISEVWVGEFQYQRLDIPNEYPYGGGNGDARHNPRRSQFRFETPRTSVWSGEGIPPRGTKCEVQPWKENDAPWVEAEFIASWLAPNGITYSWVHTGYGWHEPQMMRFRPIRTAEQIAERDRKIAIGEMIDIFKASHGLAAQEGIAALYDAGYRKVTP